MSRFANLNPVELEKLVADKDSNILTLLQSCLIISIVLTFIIVT